MTTHLEINRLRALAQGGDINAGGHRKQNMPQAHAFAAGVTALMGSVIATAGCIRRLCHRHRLFEQAFHRLGGRRADHAVGIRGIIGRQQAGGLRGLTQQLTTRPLT